VLKVNINKLGGLGANRLYKLHINHFATYGYSSASFCWQRSLPRLICNKLPLWNASTKMPVL